MDLEGLANRMRHLAKKVETNTPIVVRKLALAMDQAIVVATPVDTGRARSNWLVSLGSPATTEIDPYAPGSKGSTGAANVQAAIAQAQTALASYNGGTTIYITNNVKYIKRLNDGYSAQAPAQFVEQAIRAVVGAFKGAKLLS